MGAQKACGSGNKNFLGHHFFLLIIGAASLKSLRCTMHQERYAMHRTALAARDFLFD